MPKVLLIGDSHSVGYYGSFLKNMFEKAGWDVTKVAREGITAAAYIAGREDRYPRGKGKLSDVTGTKFDLAIITLATNDAAGIGRPSAAAGVAESIRNLASALNAVDIWWVGAPAFSSNAAKTFNPAFGGGYDLNQRAEDLWQALSPTFGDKAIDPREVTKPFVRQRDIHLGTEGGKAWAEHVYNAVTSSRAPEVPVAPVVIEQNYGWLLLGAAAIVGVLWWKRRRRAR